MFASRNLRFPLPCLANSQASVKAIANLSSFPISWTSLCAPVGSLSTPAFTPPGFHVGSFPPPKA